MWSKLKHLRSSLVHGLPTFGGNPWMWSCINVVKLHVLPTSAGNPQEKSSRTRSQSIVIMIFKFQ